MNVLITLAGLSWLFIIWLYRFRKLVKLISKKIVPYNLIKVMVIDGVLLVMLFSAFGKTPFGIQITAGMNVITTVILNIYFPQKELKK